MKKTITLLTILMLVVFMVGCETNSSNILSSNDQNAQQIGKNGSGNLSLSKSSKGKIGINVLLNTSITDEIVTELNKYGHVMDTFEVLNALRINAKSSELESIKDLPFVEAANPDAERDAPPIDTVPVEDFTSGLSPWNLDAINVTEYPWFREVTETGDGVIIGVLDTGLKDSWRQYFPQERILTEYAKSFGGGGAQGTNVSEQPNKWEHDQSSHGTHVTSTIIGYSFYGDPIMGVAPMAKIIPVKVLNQNGSGWSSVIARGITYMADLKAEEFPNQPVVINMSLGGRYLDAIEQAAIDYAISKGVIIVASAGNNGANGMGYPGAYSPVISVASCGWEPFAFIADVADPTNPSDFWISSFSSWELLNQDLDVTAPGSWIVGPYQLQSGKISYYYLFGTSMASPHVAGLVALMAEKDNSLTAASAESQLELGTVVIPGFGSNQQGHGLVQANLVL